MEVVIFGLCQERGLKHGLVVPQTGRLTVLLYLNCLLTRRERERELFTSLPQLFVNTERKRKRIVYLSTSTVC